MEDPRWAFPDQYLTSAQQSSLLSIRAVLTRRRRSRNRDLPTAGKPLPRMSRKYSQRTPPNTGSASNGLAVDQTASPTTSEQTPSGTRAGVPLSRLKCGSPPVRAQLAAAARCLRAPERWRQRVGDVSNRPQATKTRSPAGPIGDHSSGTKPSSFARSSTFNPWTDCFAVGLLPRAANRPKLKLKALCHGCRNECSFAHFESPNQ